MKHVTFDDVLLVPKFSTINSRKDIDLHTPFMNLKLPIISANMDTITDSQMANAMLQYGAIGALHRFWSIEDNIIAFKQVINKKCIVSIGLGTTELERAKALVELGAEYICIDVAHGASIQVVEQAKQLREMFHDNISLIVGNFATLESIDDFNFHLGSEVNTYKVGIGPGSVCTTRLKTGVGVPQFSAILECASTGYNVIADGGIRQPGDIAKALAAGAVAVMIGGMFAGTEESATFIASKTLYMQQYRGSASKDSYIAQGKDESWRTAEGETIWVKNKGSVKSILQDIEGGLRSAFSYVGAANLEEFWEKAEFINVSHSSVIEGTTHSKKES